MCSEVYGERRAMQSRIYSIYIKGSGAMYLHCSVPAAKSSLNRSTHCDSSLVCGMQSGAQLLLTE